MTQKCHVPFCKKLFCFIKGLTHQLSLIILLGCTFIPFSLQAPPHCHYIFERFAMNAARITFSGRPKNTNPIKFLVRVARKHAYLAYHSPAANREDIAAHVAIARAHLELAKAYQNQKIDPPTVN